MKLSNRKIIENIGILRRLSQKQLPIRVSYFLAKNISKIEKELEIYEKERQKLLNKHAEKDEKGDLVIEGNNIKISDSVAWERDITELLDIEVDVKIHKLKQEDLLNSNMDIMPSEVILIDYMIEEE